MNESSFYYIKGSHSKKRMEWLVEGKGHQDK